MIFLSLNGFEWFILITALVLILCLMNMFKIGDALAKKIVGGNKNAEPEKTQNG